MLFYHYWLRYMCHPVPAEGYGPSLDCLLQVVEVASHNRGIANTLNIPKLADKLCAC